VGDDVAGIITQALQGGHVMLYNSKDNTPTELVEDEDDYTEVGFRV
jgi:hypothetical protein